MSTVIKGIGPLLLGTLLLVIPVAVPAALPSDSSNGKSKPVKLLQQLKQKPVWEHQGIYRTILRDTQVLQHKGLRQNLITIGQEEWYKKFILGNNWKRNTELARGGEEVLRLLGLYQDILAHMENEWQGNQVHELKIMMISLSPYSNSLIEKQIKADIDSIHLFLTAPKKAKYKGNQENRKKLGVWWKFSKYSPNLIYETIRFHWENLPKNLKRRVNDWSKKILSNKNHFIGALKQTAIAHLLDQGKSITEINSLLKIPPSWNKKDYWRKETIERAKNYREDYPRWKLDGLKIDRDLSLSQDLGKTHPSRNNPRKKTKQRKRR